MPSSSRNSIRSRADILPSLCCRSRRCSPPPSGGQAVALLQFFKLLFEIHFRPRASDVRPGASDLGLQTSNVEQRVAEVRGPTPVLTHAGANWLVAVFLAVPVGRGGTCKCGRRWSLRHRWRLSVSFSDHQLFHRDLLEGRLIITNFALGHSRRQASPPAPWMTSSTRPRVAGSSEANWLVTLGLPVPKEVVVRIDHRKVVFGLVCQRIGATGRPPPGPRCHRR